NDVSDFCDILHSSKISTHIYELPPPLVSIKYIVVITTVTPTLNIENIPASSSPNLNAVVIPNQTLNNPKIIPGEISIVAAITVLFLPSVFYPSVLILTSPLPSSTRRTVLLYYIYNRIQSGNLYDTPRTKLLR